jgi:Protein N-terminal asparagine amidohydrolase
MAATSAITVYQKNWAFTSADARKAKIKTGSFGPCFVVTLTSGKFSAMAHIDDNTKVDSIQNVFNKFIENSVPLKDVKATIMGGWKDHSESIKWGEMILSKIQEAGIVNVNTKKMHTHVKLSNEQRANGMQPSEIPNHYYYGALVDAQTGDTFLLNKANEEIETEQAKQSTKWESDYGANSSVELPLSEVS